VLLTSSRCLFLKPCKLTDSPVHHPRGRYLSFRFHLDTMALPRPPRDCSICLESLALYAPLVVVVPCGHCSHKRCFDEWKAERGKNFRSTPCPCCNQKVERTIIPFFFESGPDEIAENVENGKTETRPPKPRQWWRQILPVVFFCFYFCGIMYDSMCFLKCTRPWRQHLATLSASGPVTTNLSTLTRDLSPMCLTRYRRMREDHLKRFPKSTIFHHDGIAVK
jgi:hypothetical protein